MQDFVKLARWEDRGLYAQQQATEKAQRQLQALATKAEGVLAQAAGPVLAQAANAMALDDLTPETGADAEQASSDRDAGQSKRPDAASRAAQAADDAVQVQLPRNEACTAGLHAPRMQQASQPALCQRASDACLPHQISCCFALNLGVTAKMPLSMHYLPTCRPFLRALHCSGKGDDGAMAGTQDRR